MDRWGEAFASFAPSLVPVNLPGDKFPELTPPIKSVLGVAQQRELPRSRCKEFPRSIQHARRNRQLAMLSRWLLWPDTWNNYFHPQARLTAAKVLAALPARMSRFLKPPRRCGRPLYDFGFLDQARKYLLGILDEFEPQINAGIPVVMLEPSCASVFRDELVNFFLDQDERGDPPQQTDDHAWSEERLARQSAIWQPPQMSGRRIVVHGHCHQKSLMTMKDEMKLLRATGAEVELLDSGRCGMAGPFGFEADMFEVSQTLAERVLLPAGRAAGQHDILVSNGFSCREQISQNTPRRAVHMAEVLAGDCWVQALGRARFGERIIMKWPSQYLLANDDNDFNDLLNNLLNALVVQQALEAMGDSDR